MIFNMSTTDTRLSNCTCGRTGDVEVGWVWQVAKYEVRSLSNPEISSKSVSSIFGSQLMPEAVCSEHVSRYTGGMIEEPLDLEVGVVVLSTRPSFTRAFPSPRMSTVLPKSKSRSFSSPCPRRSSTNCFDYLSHRTAPPILGGRSPMLPILADLEEHLSLCVVNNYLM